MKNDKKVYHQFLITNDSDLDLINLEHPAEVRTHKIAWETKSIIKVPFSKYKIDAEPVSEDDPESPEKEIQIDVDEFLPERIQDYEEQKPTQEVTRFHPPIEQSPMQEKPATELHL
jgi:hypothetical protein